MPSDTSTSPPFQGTQCEYPRDFATHFEMIYSSFHRPTSRASVSNGAIAGIVVGIFLGAVVFPVLAFVFWRRRRSHRHRRRRGREGDLTFIEPSIHKSFDITEALDIQPGGLGQRRKPAQSPVSEVSLDLIPVNIPRITHSRPKLSPPTFPRSPTSSSPSPTQLLLDASSRGVVHSPETVDQYLSVQVRSPPQVSPDNTPLPAVNRRSSVPKPSGPRPQSYRANTDDPRAPVFVPPVRMVTASSPTKGEEPSEQPEPEMQQVNEGGRMTTYSFLDMNSSSGAPSTIDGTGQSSRDSIPPLPHININSPHDLLITRTNSTSSRRDFDRRRESGSSKPLSLSAVIRKPPTLKCLPPTELHPYGQPGTGGASPTESVPVTMSEVSEIRFCNPAENGEPSPSQQSTSHPQLPTQLFPMDATPATSSIYQKLFGVQQGEVPPDGLLAKKRPLHRKALSISTFSTPSRS